MATAKDEYDGIFNKPDHPSTHPEDDISANVSDDDATTLTPSKENIIDSSDEDEDIGRPRLPSKYYLPKNQHYTNTGPKGVIADAQAFERAKRGSQSEFARTKQLTLPRLQQNGGSGSSSDLADDDEDEEFMRKWRETRKQELKHPPRALNMHEPGVGPYGRLDNVNALGYLDAIENTGQGIVVVVYIYDVKSQVSSQFEGYMRILAKKYLDIRFVKLSYEEAGMEVAGVPAVLAYRNGHYFANLIPLVDEVPSNTDILENLEDAFVNHNIISSKRE